MMRVMLFVSSWLLVAPLVVRQHGFVCGQPTGRAAPEIVFEDRTVIATTPDSFNPTKPSWWVDIGGKMRYQDETDANADQVNQQIIQYLNTTGSVEGLQAAIAASAQASGLTLNAEVIEADFTSDNATDVLTNITLSYGATYGEYLSLFTCASSGYILLDTLLGGGWDPGGDDIPTSVVFAVDLNNNQRRDIVMDIKTIVGMKGAEGLTFVEWEGASLSQIFVREPEYGAFSSIRLTEFDHKPATLEPVIGYSYGYGEEIAASVNEISHWRPIVMIYQWDGATFALVCTYFTDDPFTLYETLQSAETRRACDLYNDAQTYYERIWQPDYERIPWNEGELEAWGDSGWLMIPVSVTDSSAYATDLERAYLRTFAGYRLIQIHIAQGDKRWAESLVQQLVDRYAPGQRGYVYVAMAVALWQAFQETGHISDACAAAETAFHSAFENGDDPGIAYDDQGFPALHFFYRYGASFVYSPDPDNLFDVPEDIQGILDIPVCL